MPKKLKQLKINRVDLVDKGANQEAHIMLFKRADDIEKAMTLKEILDKQEQQEEAREEKWKVMDAFMDSLKSCCDAPEDERLRVTTESAKQFVEMMGPIHDALKEDVYMSAELQKQLEAIQAQNAELLKRAEAAEEALAKRADNEPEDIWKGVPDIVRKKFEEQEAEIALSKAAAKEERNKRLRQEAIQKASRYDSLPVNPDDDADLFIAIDDMEEAHAKRIYELFNAGNANLSKSLNTQERGSVGKSDEPRSDEDELLHYVNAEMEKSDSSFSDALDVVAKRHPDLYRQYSRNVSKGA